jgi:hypothetical protein
MPKKKYSNGDYEIRPDAKTFGKEFYYINFIDKAGKFDSDYSEKIEEKRYAYNRARWLSNNTWALGHIHYKVVEIGLYSSLGGHIKTYTIW